MKHHIEDTNKVELMVMGPGAGAGACGVGEDMDPGTAKIYTSLWKKISKLTC